MVLQTAQHWDHHKLLAQSRWRLLKALGPWWDCWLIAGYLVGMPGCVGHHHRSSTYYIILPSRSKPPLSSSFASQTSRWSECSPQGRPNATHLWENSPKSCTKSQNVFVHGLFIQCGECSSPLRLRRIVEGTWPQDSRKRLVAGYQQRSAGQPTSLVWTQRHPLGRVNHPTSKDKDIA